jgi:hypothetical protein
MKLLRRQVALLFTALVSAFGHAAETPKNCGCSCCEGEEVCCCNRSKTGGKPADSAHAIQAVLLERFNRPDAPLLVGPIVIEGDHAIAGWRQAKVGGRVLLQRKADQWKPRLCAGVALKERSFLQEAGLSAEAASAIQQKREHAEAALPTDERAQLDSFPRIVPLDSSS